MTPGTAARFVWRANPVARALSLVAVPLLAGLLAVLLYGEITARAAWGGPQHVSVTLWGLLVIAAIASVVRYPEEARASRVLVGGLAIALGVYALWLGTDFAGATSIDAVALQGVLRPVPYLVAAASVLAIFRPSFAAYVMVYVALHKDLTRAVSGAGELGINDYLPLAEVGLFLAVGVWTLAVAKTVVAPAGTDRRAAELSAAVLVAAAVGAHLGNYFMSGAAKIMLDGGPLTWVLENPTSALMLNGYNLGLNPLSFAPELFGWAFEAFRAVELPLNVVTLAAQVGCVVAFLHRRLLLGFTIFFDCMHIAIFLLTGALFLPWIILNSLLVAALLRLPQPRLPLLAIAVGMLVTVFGNNLFYNARLGWYDSPQARFAYFTAITDDGREIRVPGSFYRDASYLVYARHFGFREHRRASNHIPTSAWGQIGIRSTPGAEFRSNYSVMQAGKTCNFPVGSDPAAVDYDSARPGPFIRGQHARALSMEAAGRAHDYHLYPHHHFSMPWLYREFGTLSFQSVVAYRYVVETVCLSVEEGRFQRTVMARTETDPISVTDLNGMDLPR